MKRTVLYAPFIPFIVIFCLLIETCADPAASYDVSADLQLMSNFVKSLEAAIDFSPSVSRLHRLCQVLHNVASLYVESKAQQGQLQQQQQSLQQQQSGNSNFMSGRGSMGAAAAAQSMDQGTGGDGSGSGGEMAGIPLDVREFDMYLSQLGFMPGQYQQPQPPPQAQQGGNAAAVNGQLDTTMAAAAANTNTAGGGMDGVVSIHQQQQQQQSLGPGLATGTNQLGDWFSGNNYMLGLLEEDLSGIHTFNWTP